MLIAFGALLLAGCTKEQAAAPSAQDKVAVSFTAAISDGSQAKASFDNDGAGNYADRCKLQVLWNGKIFYEKTVAVADFEAKFENILLVKDQKYDFLFWADNTAGNFYVTEKLTEVKLNGDYIGGNDKRDAFYAALNDKKPSEVFDQTVELYRPFAQLNVITTDIPALRAQIADDDLFDAVVPEKVSLKLTVPTVFNVKTGEVSVPAEITYTAPVYTNPYKVAEGDKNTLSMDYFLAPVTESKVSEIKFWSKNTTSGLTDIDHSFTNIPLRRNYRTNIIGALITQTGTVEVIIKPGWLGEKDVNPFE